MKGFYALVCFFSIASVSYGQVGNFRTIATGDWNTPSTWQRDVDGNGVYTDLLDENPSTVYPTSTSGSIAIMSGHQVTIPTGITITADQINVAQSSTSKLIINGTLDLNNGTDADITMQTSRGAGGFIEVSGTIRFNEGTAAVGVTSSTLRMLGGGTYQHNYQTTAGQIYTATWNLGSRLYVTGYTTYEGDGPAGLSQTFYDVVWECPNHSGFFINLNGALTSILNDFRIINTGSAVLSLSDAIPYSLNIGGDFISEANAGVYFNYETTADADIVIEGDFDWSSNVNSGIADGGDATISVAGDFLVRSGAALRLNNGDYKTGIVNITLLGDLSIAAGGTVTKSSDALAGATAIYFNGSSLQNVVNSGAISGKVNVTVKNGAQVNFGTFAITGSGNYLLEAGGTMQVGSPDGLVKGINLGNIRVSGTRTYSNASNIVYNGSVNQNLGNEWGASGALNGASVNLTINSSGVVKNDNIGTTSVLGTLSLVQGILEIGNSNTLDVSSALTFTGGMLRGSTTSNLTFSGSGSIVGNLMFETAILNNLTIARAVDIVLATDLTIVGTINLSYGNLDLGGHTLTMNGSGISSASTGLKSSNVSSALVIGGSSFSGNVPFTGAANTIGSLTLATTDGGAYTWNSPVTVANVLNLNAGTLTHTSGIAMGNNSVVNMNGGTFSLSPSSAPLSADTYYNLVYNGTQNTGVELPSAGTSLMNLSISGGTVSLLSDAVVNGDVTLVGGILSAGTNDITLAGAGKSWIKQSGTFAPGTGAVIIAGSIAIQGTNPRFGNLNTQTGSTLTLPSGNVNISGNVQLNATSTFNNGAGTITLNGEGLQVISAAGKSFNNLTITKGTGDVNISTGLNLVGVLDIQSATTVLSDGRLTLVSTASGTASIAPLLNGGSVTGDINAQRYIALVADKYRDISAPVFNPAVSDITDSGVSITGSFTGTSYPCAGCMTNNPSFYYYDEAVAGLQTNGYVAYPPSGGNSSTSYLSPGRGYNLYLREELGSKTITLSGPINSGPVSLPVSYTPTTGGANEDGWSFIGNPYPSAINWDIIAGWSKGNISGNQIAIYDPAKGINGGYRIWNGEIGDLGSGAIAAGQGFWVQASGAPTLVVDEEAKITSSASFYRTKETRQSFMELIVEGNGSEDRAYIHHKELATLARDKYDGPKLMVKEGLNLAVVTEDNAKLSIQAISEAVTEATLPLYLNGVKPGIYALRSSLVGGFERMPIWLFDAFTNVHHDLSKDYSFEVNESNMSSSEQRFYLVIGSPSIVTDVEEPLSSVLTVYPNPVSDKLFAKVKSSEVPSGEVIDRLGSVVGYITWNEEESQIWVGDFNMNSQSAGIYFARLSIKGSVRVVKFVKQ